MTALADQYPPTVTLEDVYEKNVLPFQTERYAKLRAAFTQRFGEEPEFFARSPGRVNLIGEHIDYAGYSVLPAAIDRDVVIAVRSLKSSAPQATRIVLANTNNKFPERSFEHEENGYVTIDATRHEWSNYFKCGYKGVFEQLASKGAVSFNAMVDGTVPTGAGVSSSSAFVCCSALATLTANKGKLTKGMLTEAAIRGERYAGVQVGGMDQSISIMAPLGSPLIIHFHPSLWAEPVGFPTADQAPIFVIANTLVVADKHVTAPMNYNLRVVETRLAAALLSKHLKVKEARTLRELQDLYLNGQDFINNEQNVLRSLICLIESGLKKDPYTREEAAAALGITVPELESNYIQPIIISAAGFELYKRAKHVLSEAVRVFQFRDVCLQKPPYAGSLLCDLGTLMNDSQTSCRDLYNCSCPEIDDLTSIARKAGAYGSRLTGAGWGGCTVSLVAENDVERFIEKIKEEYYYKRWPEWRGNDEAERKMEDYVFASKPGGGAAVILIEDDLGR